MPPIPLDDIIKEAEMVVEQHLSWLEHESIGEERQRIKDYINRYTPRLPQYDIDGYQRFFDGQG